MSSHHRSHHDEPRSHRDHQHDGRPQWMPIPRGVDDDCPPGLQYLSKIDSIFVDQEIQMLEVMTGYETNNKFAIKNKYGERIFYAYEETNCCTRNICGPIRPFEMIIVDNRGKEVIHLNRPLRCDCFLCFCCLQSMTVEAPPGSVIGKIKEKFRIICPSFKIKNRRNETVLRIEGPCCRKIICCGLCGSVDFLITPPDGRTIIGKISKEWSGIVREAFTDTDFFGIMFPVDLDVRMKAVLLGACILINSMYFERRASESVDADIW